MSDRDFISVGISKESLVVTMVGFWYKKSGVFERLESICQNIPLAVLAASFHDEILGNILMEHGKLEEEFTEFSNNYEFGEFCQNIVGTSTFELHSRSRIALDLGRRLKTLPWWDNNLKEMKSIKAKLKMIRDIQDD